MSQIDASGPRALLEIHNCLMKSLGISEATHKDSYEIRGAAGLFMVTVKRSDGSTETARGYIPSGKGFESLASFHPENLSIEARRKYAMMLRAHGESQSQIAKWLNVSQATINFDLRILI